MQRAALYARVAETCRPRKGRLDQLRHDLRTSLFDVIYFLDADRIAREVIIQTIIIEEVLKHRKQLVINGEDTSRTPKTISP